MGKILKQVNLWAPILIALFALVFSINEGRQTRLHNELSVKPYLAVSSFANTEQAGYALISSGLGPAVIKWAEVRIDDKPYSNWADAESALNFPESVGAKGTFSNPWPGLQFPPNGQSLLYAVRSPNNIKYLSENVGRVQINICYCSIYGEIDSSQCWETSTNLKNIHTRCSKEPKVVFLRP